MQVASSLTRACSLKERAVNSTMISVAINPCIWAIMWDDDRPTFTAGYIFRLQEDNQDD